MHWLVSIALVCLSAPLAASINDPHPTLRDTPDMAQLLWDVGAMDIVTYTLPKLPYAYNVSA
jgi:hypothetical protein